MSERLGRLTDHRARTQITAQLLVQELLPPGTIITGVEFNRDTYSIILHVIHEDLPVVAEGLHSPMVYPMYTAEESKVVKISWE